MRWTIGKFIVAMFLLFVYADHSDAAKRVALVIGNDVYPNLEESHQLKAAVNDAETVGDALKNLGFEVIRGNNLGRQGMVDRIAEFTAQLNEDDVAAFFYAGHGVAIDNANYLVPSDVPQGSEARVRGASLSEAYILDEIGKRNVRVLLLVLDACRNNPFQTQAGRSIGNQRGLTDSAAARGVFALYSAGLRQEALDRLGPDDMHPNSVFTRVLVEYLARPGLHLADLAVEVREHVAKLARSAQPRPHEQTPAYYDQTLGGRIYLAGLPKSGDTPISAPAAPTPFVPSAAAQSWMAIRDTGSIAVLEEFARQFPDTSFAKLARARIAEIDKTQKLAALPGPASTPTAKLTGKYKAVLGSSGQGDMEIRTNPDGSQYFNLEVWYENGHSCALSGTAAPIAGAWRYMDGSTCIMELASDGKGKVTLKTQNNAVCSDYCGARASLSDVSFRRLSNAR